MNVIVIGGGASGLMAALTAARNGHAVTLLERQSRVGRKLLSTGNGRCNLTNLHVAPVHYHGLSPDFVRPALDAFDTEAALAFFHGLGLLTVAEDSGRVYPYSDQAGSVLDVLRFAADAAGVITRTGFEVEQLRRTKHGFAVSSAEETLAADRVIVCCGGMAGGKLGGTRSGYLLLQSMGHNMTKLYPALVQVKTDTTYVKALKGVRATGELTLCRGRDTVAESRGEVQFTEFGVSGPAVFDLSRSAAVEKPPLTLHIDLLPRLSAADTEALLRQRAALMPELTTAINTLAVAPRPVHIDEHLPDMSVRVLFKVGAVFRGKAVIPADSGDVGMGAEMVGENIRHREIGHKVPLHEHHIVLPNLVQVVPDTGQRLHFAPERRYAPVMEIVERRQQV